MRSGKILDHHLSNTRAILEVTKAIIEANNADEVLHAIFKAALALFDVEACSLALSETTGELNYVYSTGPGKTNSFRVPAGKGFGGWVVANGKPVLSNTPSADPRFYGKVDSKTGFTTSSLLCVPLVLNKKTIGVIQLLNTHKPHGFQPNDLNVLTLFADIAATAIKKHEYLKLVQSSHNAFREDERRRNRLVGINSQAMKTAVGIAKTAAASNSTVLLISESGTGKELMARSIHRWSERHHTPFIVVNCVALTPELLASELFGHEKGSFTGASQRKIGKFELADGGTVFLDEIGELTLNLQATLLRVLQEREFQRVGGNQNIRVNIRIIAATNRDLQAEVRAGRFREDLFYRLNVVSVNLPPLRHRREDLPELIQFFLGRYCRDTGRPLLALDPTVKTALCSYSWPGNVRQLQNTIERAVVLTRGPVINAQVLPRDILGSTQPAKRGTQSPCDFEALAPEMPMTEAVRLFQSEKIRRALQQTQGNKSQAARLLGLVPSNLNRMIKKLGLEVI